MNIAFLTADEPLYLPTMFTRIVAERGRDIRGIFIARSRYGRDSSVQMARKYIGTFGWWNFAILVRRMLGVRLRDRLGLGQSAGRFASIPALCRAHGIRCEVVENVNAPEFLEDLKRLDLDVAVSISCPQVFKQPLIELPRHGVLNVHGSDLPNYRGIAPSFWMMSKGEQQAAVTGFFVNEKLDAGDVHEVARFPIETGETLDQFIVRSKQIACDLVLRSLDRIEAGDLRTHPLDISGGSYFSFPTRAAYREFRGRGRRLW